MRDNFNLHASFIIYKKDYIQLNSKWLVVAFQNSEFETLRQTVGVQFDRFRPQALKAYQAASF